MADHLSVPAELDLPCQRYAGLDRFAMLLEALAGEQGQAGEGCIP